KENDRNTVTAGQLEEIRDRAKNRNSQRTRDPTEKTVVDHALEIDWSLDHGSNIFAGISQQIMIFRTSVDNVVGAVGWNGHEGGDQVSLFRSASVWFVLVCDSFVLESLGLRSGNSHHREIRVRDSGPIHRGAQRKSIRTAFVAVDSCRRVAFK